MEIERPSPLPVPVRDGTLHVGVGRADITPALGLGRAGYGPLTEPALGAHGRLFATAVVLDDGHGARVALIAADLHGGSRWMTERLGELLAPSHGLGADRLFFAASHVHTGPGPFYGHRTFDRSSGTVWADDWDRPFDAETAEAVTRRVHAAALEALADLRPGRFGVGEAALFGVSWHRSVEALRWNPAPGEPWLDVDAARPTTPPPDDRARLRAIAAWINAGTDVAARFDDLPPPDPSGADLALEAFDGCGTLVEALDALDPEQLGKLARARLGVALELMRRGDERETLDDRLYRLVRGLQRNDVFRVDVLRRTAAELDLRRRQGAPPRPVAPEDHLLADSVLRCLYAENEGTPERPARRAALCFFGATSTVLGDAHPLYSADAYGAAARRLERGLAAEGVLVAFAGGALGDANVVVPGLPVTSHGTKPTELPVALARVERAGRALAEGAARALRQARARCFDEGLRLEARFAEHVPSGAAVSAPDDARRLAREGVLGAPMLGASEMAGGNDLVRCFGYREGVTAMDLGWDPQDPHFPKVGLPVMAHPPTPLAFRLLRFRGAVGGRPRTFLLAGLPAEVSAGLGARMRDALLAREGGEPGRVTVQIASLVGDYAGYFVTEYEYLAQQYEGAASVWGRWSGPWAIERMVELASSADAGGPARGVARFSSEPRPARWGDPVPWLADKLLRPGGLWEGLRFGGGRHPASRCYRVEDQVVVMGCWRGPASRDPVHAAPPLRLEIDPGDGSTQVATLDGAPVEEPAVSFLRFHHPGKARWYVGVVCDADRLRAARVRIAGGPVELPWADLGAPGHAEDDAIEQLAALCLGPADRPATGAAPAVEIRSRPQLEALADRLAEAGDPLRVSGDDEAPSLLEVVEDLLARPRHHLDRWESPRRPGAPEVPEMATTPVHELVPDLPVDPERRRFEPTDLRWIFRAGLRAARWHLDPPALPLRTHLDHGGPDGFTCRIDDPTDDAPVRVAVFGDFGTGEYHARAIGAQLVRHAPAVAVHLGDVYYAGTAAEWDAHIAEPLRGLTERTELFLLAGNHEMYSHGEPYLALLDRQRHAGRQRQRGPYFRLVNDGFQILGLDTEWFGHGRVERSDHPSGDVLVRWLEASLERGRADDLFTILLTSSHGFHPERPQPLTRLGARLLERLVGRVHLWLWGNEHHCGVFAPGEGVPLVTGCVGHSGFPERRHRELPHAPHAPVVFWETLGRFPDTWGLRPDRLRNGWSMLGLNADGSVTLDLVDWLGHHRAQVTVRRGADGVEVERARGCDVTGFPDGRPYPLP